MFLRHVLLSKHRETEAVTPSTCRMICQFMLLLEQKLQTQKIQVIQITRFTNFQMYQFSRLRYRQCCLVWISVCKGIVNILSCLSGSWSAAVWEVSYSPGIRLFGNSRFGVLHGNILGFIISVDSTSVITEELCNVIALLNLHFLFFLWEQMKKAANERWAM